MFSIRDVTPHSTCFICIIIIIMASSSHAWHQDPQSLERVSGLTDLMSEMEAMAGGGEAPAWMDDEDDDEDEDDDDGRGEYEGLGL
jgi:hypothetical protein